MFDNPESLLEQIQLGEDSYLELKRVELAGGKVKGPGRDELAEELSAFANSGGGVLVLGVDDKPPREILGIPQDRLDEIELYVRQICTDSIEPELTFRSRRRKLPDHSGAERAVLQIDVPKSPFVHSARGRYFHRVGSSKKAIPPQRLARLFQERSQAGILRFDEQAVPYSSSSDLDEQLAERFLTKRTVRLDEDSLVSYRKVGLLTLDSEGAISLTIAGALMATRDPSRWVRTAYIEAVRYRGTRIDANYQLDAQQIRGPLDQQIRQAFAFVERNMSVAARKLIGREDVPQYDLKAIFEAVTNAVAHRDYAMDMSKIRLFLFDDRLELYSPGALPNTLTIELLPDRQATRNELIATLLGRCEVGDLEDKIGRRYFLEKRGEGVPIILHESERLSGRTPEYRLLDDAELMLTIWAAKAPADEDHDTT